MVQSVMIVEDDKVIRSLYAMVLGNSGYVVIEAGDGQEAIEKFTSQPCDVVITDMNMPRMGGMELIQTLRRKHPSVYIIFITAYGVSETRKKALSLGSDDYIAKPVELIELEERVRNVFENHIAHL